MFWAVKGRCENELGLPQLLLPLQLKVQRILELFGSPVLTENPDSLEESQTVRRCEAQQCIM